MVCDFKANGYRLPTEAEWEFAAKGGNYSKGFRYSGSNLYNKVAWVQENSAYKVRDVGMKLPNELGIFDMSGNVLEWCWDIYNDQYYTISSFNNPKGASLTLVEEDYARVVRGGGAIYPHRHSRISNRSRATEVWNSDMIGFRLVRHLYSGSSDQRNFIQ